MKETKKQKDKIRKVMHEFKEGELHIGKSDKIVKDPKQAMAIALSEAHASNKMAHGGIMGDIYSIKNQEQFKQLITVYNELSEKFGVVNYFLDENDNSIVFLMGDEDYKKTIELQKYANSLHERGFDIFDKTQKIEIKKDNSKNGKHYFKLNLSKKIMYANGGELYNNCEYTIGGL